MQKEQTIVRQVEIVQRSDPVSISGKKDLVSIQERKRKRASQVLHAASAELLVQMKY